MIRALLKHCQVLWFLVGAAWAAEERSLTEWQTLLADRPGEAASGAVVFSTWCLACHADGDGGSPGRTVEELRKMAVSQVLRGLQESSERPRGAERPLVVVTDDQETVVGIPVASGRDELVRLRTLGGYREIPRGGIKRSLLLPTPMKPARLLSRMREDDVRHLMAWIASDLPLSSVRQSFPESVPAPAMLPEGLREAEEFHLEVTAGTASGQDMRQFSEAQWSGNRQLWWRGTQPGDVMTLTFEIAERGVYALVGAFTRAPDYGIVRVSLDGLSESEAVPVEIDLYGTEVLPTVEIPLGVHQLAAGSHRVMLEITGKNSQAHAGHMVGIDFLRVTQAKH